LISPPPIAIGNETHDAVVRVPPEFERFLEHPERSNESQRNKAGTAVRCAPNRQVVPCRPERSTSDRPPPRLISMTIDHEASYLDPEPASSFPPAGRRIRFADQTDAASAMNAGIIEWL